MDVLYTTKYHLKAYTCPTGKTHNDVDTEMHSTVDNTGVA